jgi:hypothetical protein
VHLRSLRFLLAFPVLSLVIALPSLTGGGSQAFGADKSSPPVTCKQLTKAQIQPFTTVPITQVKVTAALNTSNPTGQQCVWSGSGESGGIDVLVLKGKQNYNQDVRDSHLTMAVPGVGDKAARAKGDFQIDALKGDEFCSVSVGESDEIPGVSTLEAAAGDTSDIPESANATIAKALGTICNRLFKNGNTTPSFAGLSAATATTTSAP